MLVPDTNINLYVLTNKIAIKDTKRKSLFIFFNYTGFWALFAYDVICDNVTNANKTKPPKIFTKEGQNVKSAIIRRDDLNV
jgi:hypothetical protein